jgi:hypothetical protein
MMGDWEDGPMTRHGVDGDGVRYRPGDVLKLECPLTETTVASVSPSYVSVRWPWNKVDPEAHSFRWNGESALPMPGSYDWDRSYFRRLLTVTGVPGGSTRPGTGTPSTVSSPPPRLGH